MFDNYNNAQYQEKETVNYGKVASVFIIFGLISFIAAWYFSSNVKQVKKVSFQPHNITADGSVKGVAGIVGPIVVGKDFSSYEVSVNATMPLQSWSYVEGEVLDEKQEYLYSFGKEMWYESGYDSDGSWVENNGSYDIDLTFPKAGTYFLRFNTNGNGKSLNILVTVNKRRGSGIPHFWFGVICIIIGISVNEVRNRTISRMIG